MKFCAAHDLSGEIWRCESAGMCLRPEANERTPAPPVRLCPRVPLATFAARELHRLPVPEPWASALGGGLAAGAAILVTGRAGCGKTTEALALAAAVPNALYMPCEPNQSPADLRAIALRAGLEISRLNVAQPATLAEACTALAEHPHPPLAIIDSISVLGEACEVWRALRAAAPNSAIVAIVHVTKTGRMAGREQLVHLADAQITITRSHLVTGKNRHAAGAGRLKTPRATSPQTLPAEPRSRRPPKATP